MNSWILLIAAGPFLAAYLINRWIMSNATQALEPHHKIILVGLSKWSWWSGEKRITVFVLMAASLLIIPQALAFIYTFVVLADNWLTLRRLWTLEIPKSYKQKSLIASVIFSVGILISIMIVQEMFLSQYLLKFRSG